MSKLPRSLALGLLQKLGKVLLPDGGHNEKGVGDMAGSIAGWLAHSALVNAEIVQRFAGCEVELGDRVVRLLGRGISRESRLVGTGGS